MDPHERALPEAAACMTAQDLDYLQKSGMLGKKEAPSTPSRAAPPPSDPLPVEPKVSTGKSRTKRRRVQREWPDVGVVLEAEYEGVSYRAEVIEAPQYKSGKALRMLSGPAAGTVSSSMSGAMLKATQAQREDHGLGQRGMANGWGFWTVKGKADTRPALA